MDSFASALQVVDNQPLSLDRFRRLRYAPVEKHSTGGELKTVGAPYLALSARCESEEAEQPCLSG
jgi:hypothetical protein